MQSAILLMPCHQMVVIVRLVIWTFAIVRLEKILLLFRQCDIIIGEINYVIRYEHKECFMRIYYKIHFKEMP